MKFFHTNVSKEIGPYLEKMLDNEWLSEGVLVRDFEMQLQQHLGFSRKPVAVNSGTSGLHLALAVAGVQEGDEVILPAQTFISSGLTILMQKAKPIFADIQPDTGNICPKSIQQKITGRTKAILPVHWAGTPCDMDEIGALGKKYGLAIIEDAAHAIGSSYKNRPIGSISDFTVFSFQAIKHLTTGDGGAVACIAAENEKELTKRRWFDIDRETTGASILGEREYDALNIGYKYHMNDVAAAIGLGNLGNLSKHLRRHREVAAFYRDKLKNVSGIELLKPCVDRESSFWLFTFLVEKREAFVRALAENGIPASVVHRRIDRNSVFGGVTPGLPGQELFEEKQISLPIHMGLSDEELQTIVDTVQKGW